MPSRQYATSQNAMSTNFSHFMSSLFAGWRASRYSRLATFTIFISAALVLSSSEIANKATHPHLRDGRNGDSNIARIDGGETFEFWLHNLPSILKIDSRFMDLFKLFMMRYRRLYLFSSEMVSRAKVFVNNTLEAELLEQKNPLARFGITAYSDLEREEFIQNAGISTTRVVSRLQHVAEVNDTTDTTRKPLRNSELLHIASFRMTNMSGPIRLQGAWASSAGHAVAAAVETAIAIKQRKLIQLSVQELMDCAEPRTISEALSFLSQHGLVEEFEHPYMAHPSNCSDSSPHLARFGRSLKFTKVGASEGELMRALQQYGSVVAQVPVCADLWQHYQGGIISSECAFATAQGTLAVHINGWGIENGHRYWNIRTSLGSQYGEKGYVRLLLGRGLWELASEAYAVEL